MTNQSPEPDYSKLTNIQDRLGNTVYIFPTFDDVCRAIARHQRYIGFDDGFQQLMREENIPFTIKGTYDYKENIHGTYIPSN